MKKLFTLIMLIFTTLSFSQSEESYFLRSELFQYGKRDQKGKVDWTGPLRESEVLITLKDDKITIYSDEKQIYRTIEVDEIQDGLVWYCVDNKGQNCNIYLMNMGEEYLNKIALFVEYNNYVWYYICRKD
jgi:hypothetical protein